MNAMQPGTMLAQMDQDEAAEQRRIAWQKIQDAVAPIIGELNREVSRRMQRRTSLERRWLEDLRQYHGQYEGNIAEILRNDAERSSAFINITRPKTNAWRARLGDMLFPNDERNWGIDPTPVPTLTEDARKAAKKIEELDKQIQEAVDANNADVEAGGPGNPEAMAIADQQARRAAELRQMQKDIQQQVEEARRRCAAMQREIDDQLTEARYPSKCRDVIDDMCKVGVGVLKGPIVNSRARQMWEVDGTTGEAVLVSDDTSRPTLRRVSYWHFFPDPDAETIDEGSSTFERHLPNAKILRRMAKDMGFAPHAVREMLKEGPRISSMGQQDFQWMTELRSMEGTSTSTEVVDTLSDRWCIWEYHGALEIDQIAAMIRAMGRFDDAQAFEDRADPLDELMVRVFFCGDRLLKIEEDYLLDSGASLYSVPTFEKSEASIMGGIGVPRLMRHEQAMLNSAVRMMMDNAALATGPQVVIDKQIVEPENGKWKLTPRKVWQRIKTAAMGERENARPFEVFDIPMNQALLADIIQIAVKFVDEAVAMPLIAQGEQGAHVTNTAHGMSMLFNSANVVFRRVVKNWDDDVTTGLIQRFFDFNMQFNPKTEIKGDMKVEARGTSVLLVREMQADQMMTILAQWSTHPIMGVGLRAYNCMRLVLQAMNINPDDVLISEEEYLQQLKAMSAPDQQGPSPEQIRAETQLQVAEIDAMSRREQGEVSLAVAELGREVEFAKLAQNREISLEQVKAMFASKELDAKVKILASKLKTESDERKMAAEIGFERQSAREAQAQGMMPTGSGGYVSAGGRPR